MKKADLVLRALLTLVCFTGGIGDFIGPAPMVETFRHLGVPAYYMLLFGVVKMAAVLGLWSRLAVKTDVFREGAQWGVVLYFFGASATHVLAGDAAGMGAPTAIFLVAVASLFIFEKMRASPASA